MIKAERYTNFWDIHCDIDADGQEFWYVTLTIFLAFTGVDRERSNYELFLKFGVGKEELASYYEAGWKISFTTLPRPNVVFAFPYDKYEKLIGNEDERYKLILLAVERCASVEQAFNIKEDKK